MALVTVALLMTVEAPGATTFTTIWIVAVDPLASVARLHLTVPADPVAGRVQLHPGWVALTNWVFAGRASATDTPVAAWGPALATVMVYVSFPPFLTGLGVAPRLKPRSAAGWIPLPVNAALCGLPGASSLSVRLR